MSSLTLWGTYLIPRRLNPLVEFQLLLDRGSWGAFPLPQDPVVGDTSRPEFAVPKELGLEILVDTIERSGVLAKPLSGHLPECTGGGPFLTAKQGDVIEVLMRRWGRPDYVRILVEGGTRRPYGTARVAWLDASKVELIDPDGKQAAWVEAGF